MEHIIYKGNKYKRTREGYYLRTDRLHRRIWEDNFGAIPEGFHIHHKNGIKGDNRIENLECISEVEHHSLHFDPEIQLKAMHSKESRAKAASWARSKEARSLFSGYAKKHWKERKPIERTCVICNVSFQTMNFSGTKYCSRKCRQFSGYRSSKSKRSCEMCGKDFVSQRGRACSRQCGANLAAKNRRENRENDFISSTEQQLLY